MSVLSLLVSLLLATIAHAPWGLPRVYSYGGAGPVVDTRQAYVVGVDNERHTRWVAYEARHEWITHQKREGKFRSFRADPLMPPVASSDYTNSGYSRGHLLPFRLAGGRGDEALLECNMLANAAPQHQSLNGAGGVWYRIEQGVVKWLEQHPTESLWVACGPVAGKSPKRKGDLQIPAAFWLVLARRDPVSGEPRPLAFLIPHFESKRKPELRSYVVSVDLIERLEGIDLFPDLDRQVAERIESKEFPFYEVPTYNVSLVEDDDDRLPASAEATRLRFGWKPFRLLSLLPGVRAQRLGLVWVPERQPARRPPFTPAPPPPGPSLPGGGDRHQEPPVRAVWRVR